jgi:hypothetical protein
MSYRIRPEEMFLNDFRRHGLLRHVARYKCKCGAEQKALALELARVFGGDHSAKITKIQPFGEVTKKARDRQITQCGIDQLPIEQIALKYGLSTYRIREILDAGLDRKWPTK